MTDAPYFLADFTDANGTYEKASLWLHDGVSSSNHPFRLLTVATIGVDDLPNARLVVLRNFVQATRTLEFHTDVRSPKVAQLRRNPHVCLLFYDPVVRFQLRIAATAQLYNNDDIAHYTWRTMRDTSRSTYIVGVGPGGLLKGTELAEKPSFQAEDEAAALANFVVVRCEFHEMDLLELHPTGHRRALLQWVVGCPVIQRIAP